jgi:hypothetical protein
MSAITIQPGPGAAAAAAERAAAGAPRGRALPPPPLLGGFEGHLQAATREEKLTTAAEQLVAGVLVLPVLDQLRESSQAAPPFAPGDAERRFGPLLDQALADRITRSANFPLVDRVREHLLGPDAPSRGPQA